MAKLSPDYVLRVALLETGLVQPVSASWKGGHVEVLSRQVPGQEKSWLMVVSNLLVTGVPLHICRRYLLKGGQMAFGWHIQLDAKNLKELNKFLDPVVKELAEAKPTLDTPQKPAALQEEKAPPQRYKSGYSTDAEVSRKMGITEDEFEDSGRMGRVNANPRLDLNAAVNVSPSSPSLRVVRSGRNSKGAEEYELEMPLPHVNRDLNIPKHKDGRGAKPLGGS